MSIILLVLAVLLSLAGLFYFLQSRRVRESQSDESLIAGPARPAGKPQPRRDATGGDDKAGRGLGLATGTFAAFGRGAKAAPAGAGKSATTLQGNLAETPLHDFLQYLSLGRKAGILELASGRRTGRMVFQSGKVYKASFRGKEALDAIFMMLDLPEGDFEFHEQALDEVPAQHPLEVVDVIMLWMDRKPKKKQAAR